VVARGTVPARSLLYQQRATHFEAAAAFTVSRSIPTAAAAAAAGARARSATVMPSKMH